MNGDRQSGLGRDDPSNDGGQIDEGRRYWKAAIAHLAPEKRAAAWEFYLDRLESSAAADTLGGVMLLLEAHIAFFDDLPIKLDTAARSIQDALNSGGQNSGVSTLPTPRSAAHASVPTPQTWRLPLAVTGGLFAASGALLAIVAILAYQHFQKARPTDPLRAVHDGLLVRTHLVSIEPWDDPATHRRKGCVILFRSTASSESTPAGGAKVYLLSPVEDVRENLEALKQLPH